MSAIQIPVERELPCECLALVATPFPACPCCDGTGLSWQEVLVDVEYQYHRASRGARDRYGAPLEPDEDEGIEIVETSIPLTRAEEDRAEQLALEEMESV